VNREKLIQDIRDDLHHESGLYDMMAGGKMCAIDLDRCKDKLAIRLADRLSSEGVGSETTGGGNGANAWVSVDDRLPVVTGVSRLRRTFVLFEDDEVVRCSYSKHLKCFCFDWPNKSKKVLAWQYDELPTPPKGNKGEEI
jgi:hypothetical protein